MEGAGEAGTRRTAGADAWTEVRMPLSTISTSFWRPGGGGVVVVVVGVAVPRSAGMPCLGRWASGGKSWALGLQEGAEFGEDGRSVRPSCVGKFGEAFVKRFTEGGDR